ncbi:MAG: phosphonate C-P lyase system protein PhnL [Alphaproteobacteria bacterium]|nr:phosphonate C-P lyase system protein PhnL [Alphaproteobacteria bacterium]
MTTSELMIRVVGLSKRFVLHAQGAVELGVLDRVSLDVARGECVALDGPSGIGKSTLLRTVYANYKADAGQIWLRHDGALVDLVTAPPRQILEVRRRTLGYISQFLHVIPRVPTLKIVAEPLRMLGVAVDEAEDRAAALLRRLGLPEALWSLAPATFSGGEQQRVNIARGFIAGHPVLLLDEPTSALDAENRARVVELIVSARDAGTAMLGIFHDQPVREAVATNLFKMPRVAVANGAA